MQATPYPNVPAGNFNPQQQEMIDKPVDYDEQRLLDAINHLDIKSVRVFRKQRKNKNKAAKASRRKNR